MLHHMHIYYNILGTNIYIYDTRIHMPILLYILIYGMTGVSKNNNCDEHRSQVLYILTVNDGLAMLYNNLRITLSYIYIICER